MPFPSAVFSGRSVALCMQTGANPTPLTIAQLSTWTAQVANIVPIAFGGLGTGGTLLTGLQSAVPIGSTPEIAQFGQTGFIQGDQIPVQNQTLSQALTATFLPADTSQQLIVTDGNSGSIDRTFVWVVNTGVAGAATGIWAYAFNARVTGISYDLTISQEGRLTFTLVPRGNQYGISTPA